MGDRLVCVISKDDKILAASYQHWSAGDHTMARNIIDSHINNWKGEIDQYAAVKILEESIKEFNGYDKPIALEVEHYDWSKNDEKPFSSEEEKKFASLHPDIVSDWTKADRTDGILCINEEKIDDWREWSEWEEWIEI